MCDFTDRDIKLPKWSCVLNCYSECPGFFFNEAESNWGDYVYLSFIHFHHYKDIISCYSHKHLLPEHVKTCPPCTNLENVKKGKFTTRKSLVLKSWSILDLHSEYYIPKIKKKAFHLPHDYILGKIVVQVNNMICLWVNTIMLT